MADQSKCYSVGTYIGDISQLCLMESAASLAVNIETFGSLVEYAYV